MSYGLVSVQLDTRRNEVTVMANWIGALSRMVSTPARTPACRLPDAMAAPTAATKVVAAMAGAARLTTESGSTAVLTATAIPTTPTTTAPASAHHSAGPSGVPGRGA